MMIKVQELDPKDVEARQYLFEIYRRQQKPKKAVEQALEILKLKPGQEALYTYVYQYYDGKQDYQALFDAASDWVTRQPDSIMLWQNLAYAQVKLHQWPDAAKTYEEILKRKPDDVDLLFTLADLYEKAKDLKAAKEAYQRILNIDPENEKAAEAHVRVSLEEIKTRRVQ
jgi:tetratricopeptide (TPR) repeat protein